MSCECAQRGWVEVVQGWVEVLFTLHPEGFVWVGRLCFLNILGSLVF